MGKVTKTIIIGVIIFFIGLMTFSCAMYFMNWDFRNLSTLPKLSVLNKEYSADFNISLFDSNMPVEIKESADDKIHLTYYESSKEYYEFINNGNDLKINKVRNYKWFDYFFNINFQMPEFIISVPKNYGAKLDINTSNSKIILNSISAEDIKLKTSNSKIEFYDAVSMNDITAVSSNGKIKAEKTAAKGNVSLNTSNSKIYLKNIIADELNVNTSNGKIEAEEIKSLKKLSFDTSNASIKIRDIISKDISLTTSNGDIEGNINGRISDYSIVSKTSNGDNSLPEKMNAGPNLLYVKTSNSDIEITFDN